MQHFPQIAILPKFNFIALKLMLALLAFSVLNYWSNPADAKECPDGYRLQYQGFCINREDEQSNVLGDEVRGTLPFVDSSGVYIKKHYVKGTHYEN